MTDTDKKAAQEAEAAPTVDKVKSEAAAETQASQPTRMTLEEAIKQKLAQKKQAQVNEKNKPKQSPGNMNLRNQNSNRNNALGRRNKV